MTNTKTKNLRQQIRGKINVGNGEHFGKENKNPQKDILETKTGYGH